MVIPELQATWDLWVDCTKENYQKLLLAFKEFRMPVFDMIEEKFLLNEKFDVFRFGRQPIAIDIMTKMADLNFTECLEKAQVFNDDGLLLPVVHINNLITAKKIAGRNKDLNDLEFLLPEE